jgi:hypothetical protein
LRCRTHVWPGSTRAVHARRATRAVHIVTHIQLCYRKRWIKKLTIRPSYRTRLFDSKFSYLHAYTQLWQKKHKKSKCECDGLEGYRIFVTAACAAAAASAGLAPSCAKCCFCGAALARWQLDGNGTGRRNGGCCGGGCGGYAVVAAVHGGCGGGYGAGGYGGGCGGGHVWQTLHHHVRVVT